MHDTLRPQIPVQIRAGQTTNPDHLDRFMMRTLSLLYQEEKFQQALPRNWKTPRMRLNMDLEILYQIVGKYIKQTAVPHQDQHIRKSWKAYKTVLWGNGQPAYSKV